MPLTRSRAMRGVRAKSATIDQTLWTIGASGDLSRVDGLVSPYAQNAWVYAAVESLARKVESAPFRVYTGSLDAMDEGKPVSDSDEWARLFAQPDPRHTSSSWFGDAKRWYDTEGESFAVAFADKGFATARDPIREMLLIAPRFVSEIIDQRTNLVEAWMISDGSRSWRIPAESVWHLKRFNPLNPWRGQSAIQAALMAIQGVYRGEQYIRGVAENDATPGVAMFVPSSVAEEQRRAIRARWEDRHQGSAKAARLAILSDNTKLEVFNRPSIDDMGQVVLREDARKQIMASIGVTAWDLAETDKVNTYTAALVSESWSWKNGVIPWMRLVEESLRKFIGNRWDGMWGAFDLTQVEALQSSLSDKLGNAEKMSKLGYALNDVNDRLGLAMPEVVNRVDPSASLDGRQSQTMMEIAAAVAAGTIEPEQAVALIGVTFPGIDPKQAAEIAGKGKTYTPPPKVAPTMVPEPPQDTPAATAKYLTVRERIAHEDDREWMTFVAKVYRKSTGPFAAALSRMLAAVGRSLRSVFGRMLAPIKALADRLFAIGEFQLAIPQAEALARLMRATNAEAVKVAAETIAKVTVEELATKVINGETVFATIREADQAVAARQVEWMTETRKALIGRATKAAQSIGEGATYSAVYDSLVEQYGIKHLTKDAFGNPMVVTDEKFARRIAVAAEEETFFIASLVRNELQVAAGVKIAWRSMRDRRVRPSHVAADSDAKRHPRNPGEPFANGLLFPHQPGAPMSETMQCRCVAATVTADGEQIVPEWWKEIA